MDALQQSCLALPRAGGVDRCLVSSTHHSPTLDKAAQRYRLDRLDSRSVFSSFLFWSHLSLSPSMLFHSPWPAPSPTMTLASNLPPRPGSGRLVCCSGTDGSGLKCSTRLLGEKRGRWNVAACRLD